MKDFRNVTKTIWFLVFGVVSLFLLACEDQTSDIPHTNSEFSISMPEGVENLKVVDQTLKMTNLSTGKVTVLDDLKNVSLLEGLYDCVYSANVIYTAKNSEGEEIESKGILTGKAENVEVTGETKNISIETYLSAENDDFIFEEIFFSGTLRSSGLQYNGDSYIKIYNNTDHVLYADGLAFCESKFKSTQYFEYTPDIRKDTMTIWSLYVVPGSGHDHPVLPGHSMILCDTGIDQEKKIADLQQYLRASITVRQIQTHST